MNEEQILALINNALSKIEKKLNDKLESLEIPDTRNLATKKFVSDAIEEVKKSFANELSTTNATVNKIALETDTKISALTVKKTGFKLPGTLLDDDN